jgi:hypothetical protein
MNFANNEKMKKSFFTVLFSSLLTFCANGQELKGITIDGHRNRLIAINVMMKGTGMGTITDDCGRFSIPIDKEELTLVFHGMSYDDMRNY